MSDTTAGAMPTPLSVMAISTLSSFWWHEITILPFGNVNLMALLIKFLKTAAIISR